VQAEKKKHDFMDFGMSREYLDALDDVEFTVEEQLSLADQVTSRWKIRGTHRRPLLGIEPGGDQVVIEGITLSVIKNERVRQEWAFWEFPAFTQSVAGT
jgi:predicted ester cyclase